MASPSAVPYLATRAAPTWGIDVMPDDAMPAAIAFPNDMSRSKYPAMHESVLSLPSEPPAAMNSLISVWVQWPGADPWAKAGVLPPPHAVIVTAVTAAASGPARRECFLCTLNSMIPPLIQAVQAGQASFSR